MKRLSGCLLAALLLLSGCAGHERQESLEPPPRQVTEPAAPDEIQKEEPPEEAPPPEPADADFVRVADYIPGIAVDLRYATADNFTGQVLYDFSDAWLRYGTVKKLSAAQTALEEQGYGLKLWDAFRPPAVQFTMWEICPDAAYVADPQKGYSSHSRGGTVDVTLLTADGAAVVMPTGFDDFSPLADRDYHDVADQTAVEHARLLEQAMTDAGFKPYAGEWWHFSDTDGYDVEETLTPEMMKNTTLEEHPHG